MSEIFIAGCVLVAVSACSTNAAPDGERRCGHCPEMVTVPAGTAILGAGSDDPFSNADELPERRIEIEGPFAVGRHEITRGQYEAFVRATRRAIGGNCLTDRVQRGSWAVDATTTFQDPGFEQTDDHPVTCVSWEEAQAYVAWLNSQTAGGYRLLSEVEWEYVARAGALRNTPYPWGADPGRGCVFANGFDRIAMATYVGIDTSGYEVFDPMPCTDNGLNTIPVGSLAANGFGVHDMIGNVSEWIADCHLGSHERPPAAGEPLTTGGACARRIAKGGSWGTLAHNLRTAERLPYPATHRDDSIGFRVARTLAAD